MSRSFSASNTPQQRKTQTLTPQQQRESDAARAERLSAQIQQLSSLSASVLKKKRDAETFSFEYLGLHKLSRAELVRLFGDIRFIAIMGPSSRAETVASLCISTLKIASKYDRLGNSEHFSVFKARSVLCCSHGMGLSSVCLFLNELLRVMALAQNSNFEVVRLGSSGGIGVRGGTLVVSSAVLDDVTLLSEWRLSSCGREMRLECALCPTLAKRLLAIAKAKKCAAEMAKTVSTETYYEAQARLDGALCEYGEKRKMAYLRRLFSHGVRNFEMEMTVVAAMCKENDIRCGMLCVAYLDRLKEDTVAKEHSVKETKQWMDNAIDVLLQYIYQFVIKK